MTQLSKITINGRQIDHKYNTLLDIATADVVKKFSPDDITVCVGLRLSDVNPWVLDRLSFLLDYYKPSPNFLVVDFGSDHPYSDQVQAVCENGNAHYVYVDDKETFSLAKSRNIAAQCSKTDLLLFNDVDVVFDRDIFEKLANLANVNQLSISPRKYIMFPVYHLTKWITEEFVNLSSAEKDNYLKMITYKGVGSNFGNYFQLVAPYSNIYLIHRKFFNLSGGYCDLFRGHGSEDFEFLIRLGLLSSNIPCPNNLISDSHGPLKPDFWEPIADYSGFRKYTEALAVSSEIMGLKCYHMFHQSPAEKGYWTQKNDWKRQNFNRILSVYYPRIEKIIEQDYIKRDKRALCIFNDEKQWGYFLPLRLYGYSLTVLSGKDDSRIGDENINVGKKIYDRIFIFNPYMKSHEKYRDLLKSAKDNGIRVTVIERGGLPNSIYYADEVVYGDETYHDLDAVIRQHEIQDESQARALINKIRTGSSFLENQEKYADSRKKLAKLKKPDQTYVFVPLQMSMDMAVTKFTDGYESYSNFMKGLASSVKGNKNITFVIKRHPLAADDLSAFAEDNVIMLSDNTNVHALIDFCDFTILYNSGVGLLSCIHNKPTFNIGNSYYSCGTALSNRCSTVQEAIKRFSDKQYHFPGEREVTVYVDWLITKKYSWFHASDVVKDFGDRKSHGYDNIVVDKILLDEKTENIGNGLETFKVTNKSYLNHRVNMFSSKKNNVIETQTSNVNVSKVEDPKTRKQRLIRKFKNRPYEYCADSKNPFIRMCRIFFVSDK